MFKIRKSDFFTSVCIVCFILNLHGCSAQPRRSHHGSQRRNNQNSQVHHPEASLPGGLHEAYLNAVGQQDEQESVSAWDLYTPSIPTPLNSDCLVNVCHLQRGRCTQLGGNGEYRPYICQSGDQFEFQQECRRILFQRLFRGNHNS